MKQALLVLLLISLTTFSVFAQKQQVDSEFEGFKGRVKSVTIERAELTQSSGTTVEAKRLMQKMHTFDADGNFVLDKAYDHMGEEFDLRTYSVIDGQRVVKHDVLSKNVIEAFTAVGNATKPSQDPRYSAKIKYKYDKQGNRTEEAWVSQDGKTYLRYVYKRTGRRQETKVYAPDGSFSHGYADILDDKGNVVEWMDLSKNASGPGSKYTYLEFDSQGNWTKRKESRGDSSAMTYRTITYF